MFIICKLIKEVIIGDGTITGELIGVTIKGDRIEGGTIIAEKLVIKGEDGLFYKLNTDGITTELEQTEHNSLDGKVIIAKSITATKINVDDLVAFGATIGGFRITENSIYSGVKTSVDNTTKGMYMDNDGQLSFGDGTNFLTFYEENGVYKLRISVSELRFSSSNRSVESVIGDVQASVDKAAGGLDIEYYHSASKTALTGGNWVTVPPEWIDGKFMWTRAITRDIAGNVLKTSDPTCISGADGKDSREVRVVSSKGGLYVCGRLDTILTAQVYIGGTDVTD